MNKENLLLLAERLEKLPANYSHFNMSNFVLKDGYCTHQEPDQVTKAVIHGCGTCACALGHAPTIRGLKARKGEGWDGYCLRVFGIAESDPAWDYLFAGSWSEYVDERHGTAHAAAKRIRDLIANGVPYRDEKLDYIDA